MNGLPPSRPLPADVRERALRTVLAGMDAPPRRRAPFLAAAAAVVVALTVTSAVALSGPEPDTLAQLAADRPVTTGDPVTDPVLLRCAAAVQSAGRTSSYPPVRGWRVTDVLLRPPLGEVAIAIDDAFACLTREGDVWLSPMHGTPAGAAEVALLTPGVMVVLNPQRRSIAVAPADAFGDGRTDLDPTAPVQFVELGDVTGSAAGYGITVAGSYSGPLPDPAPFRVLVQDEVPVPAPDPVYACLARGMPGGQPGLGIFTPGVPSALASTTSAGGGVDAGFCVDGGQGAVYAGAVGPVEEGTGPTVVAVARAGRATGVLIALPPDATRVEITGPATRTGARCVVGGGLALCALADVEGVTVTVYDSAGRGTPVRVP